MVSVAVVGDGSVRVVVETASVLIAALAAGLIVARYRRPLVVGELVLAAAVIGLALINVVPRHLVGGMASSQRSLDVLAAVVSLTAAVVFGARATKRADHLSAWVAAASFVAFAATLSFASSTITTGTSLRIADPLRLVFATLLLCGGVAEMRSHWQRLAVVHERRRLARDLHDGVAQELAYIATEARRGPHAAVHLPLIAAAAQRGLDESRRAISALSQPLDQPLDDAVAEAAEEITGRVGVSLHLNLDAGVDVSSETREQLMRILREAVGNAARHASAATITVLLKKDDERLRLYIVDDGHGFEPSATIGRFGLTTMSERANAVGGKLSIASEVGTGTIVDLTVPLVPSA